MGLVSSTFLLSFILSPFYPLHKIIVLLLLLILMEVHVKNVNVLVLNNRRH